MTSAKILNLNLNNSNTNNKCNEQDSIADSTMNNKTKSNKKLSINSRNLSSTSSMNNKSPLFNDDDDDRFYDAADIDSKDLDKIIKSTNRFLLDDNDAIFDDDDDDGEIPEQDDNDDDDFYDTKTSRHPSEMSDSNYLINLKHHNHHRSHRMSSHTEEKLNSPKLALNGNNSSKLTDEESNQDEKSIDNFNNSNNVNNDNAEAIKIDNDEDEMDFELETGWTFWIDK